MVSLWLTCNFDLIHILRSVLSAELNSLVHLATVSLIIAAHAVLATQVSTFLSCMLYSRLFLTTS